MAPTKKSKAPKFTASARVVMAVECTIDGEPDMASALAFAKTLKPGDFAQVDEDCNLEDWSVLITGISGDKHYDVEQ